MKLYMFAVRDRAVDAFANPICLKSAGEALRSFTDAINQADKDSQLYQHPDDFDLYCCGTFDSTTGRFEGGDPEMIGIGKNLKVRSNGS